MDRKSKIKDLYRKILGREADLQGLANYNKSTMSLYDIQVDLWKSNEFKEKRNIGFPEDKEPVNSPVKIFIVNLKRRPDRREVIEKRLRNLCITNYEIIDAVDGKELPEDLTGIYDEDSSIEIHRKLEKSEIGCALSHVNIARKVIEQNLDYAIILEDDAELTLEFKEFIKNFNLEPNKFDFLMFGCFSSNQWFNCKLKTNIAPYELIEKQSIVYLDEIDFNVGDVSIHKPHYPTQVLDFVNATHAYMISNKGAKFLLENNYPVKLEADNVWNYYHDKCVLMFTNPILAHAQHADSDIHNERSQYQGENNFEKYSNKFKERQQHPDFGT